MQGKEKERLIVTLCLTKTPFLLEGASVTITMGRHACHSYLYNLLINLKKLLCLQQQLKLLKN